MLLFSGLALPRAVAQVTYQSLASFGVANNAGPDVALVQGSNGVFYATTTTGGANGLGSIFRINADGTGYTSIWDFSGVDGDGANPQAGLILGSDGKLYGTTSQGGGNNAGIVFKLATNGSSFVVLYAFTGTNGDGASPAAPLIRGSDGALYGTTLAGGGNNAGTVFKLNTDGTGYSILRSFTGTNGDGAYPSAGLLQGTGNVLYGTTAFGGAGMAGTVFKLNPNGTGYTNIHSFIGSDGEDPCAALIQGTDGLLYGTTYYGGGDNQTPNGTAFKLKTDGTGFQLLASFDGFFSDGGNPQGSLLQWTDGTLYGTVVVGANNFDGAVFNVNTNGLGFNLVYNFGASNSDGTSPRSALMRGASGKFYGLTSAGGAYGNGTLYDWDPSVLTYASLASLPGVANDGTNARASVVEGPEGVLYGTTSAGGAVGSGTVFKINRDGSGYSTLHDFNGPAEGSASQSGLVLGSDFALYGAETTGGTNGYGSIYKLNRDGSGFTNLHTFAAPGNGDGSLPQAALLSATNGLLYGTTAEGGASNSGIIYRINPDGSGYTNMHNFSGVTTNGQTPATAMIQGQKGVLYGVTFAGGSANLGVVFRMNPDGTSYTNIHSFAGPPSDGKSPVGGLMQDSNGMLYGTCLNGGANNNGTIFKLATNGTLYSLLWNFTAVSSGGTNADGAGPVSTLTQGPDGLLYGTTQHGGPNGLGTLFRVPTNSASLTNVHSFTGANGDGATSGSGLFLASDGIFYGTTMGGGLMNVGSIFALAAVPGNDRFTNATKFNNLITSGNGNNFNATLETGEPNPGNVLPANPGSVWWSWTAPASGPASVIASGTSFDALLAVYTGTTVSSLTRIASNTATVVDNEQLDDPGDAGMSNRVSFTAVSNTTYRIQVGGLQVGRIHLLVQAPALQVLSTNQTNNPDNTISFSSSVKIGNAGFATPGPLRLRVLAHAGLSQKGNVPNVPPLPPDQVLAVVNLTSPVTVTPGATTTMTVAGKCPAPIVVDPNAFGAGWGVFVLLEEQSGSDWFLVDEDLLFYDNPVWPVIGSFQGPGGGVIRINPSQAVSASSPGYVQLSLAPPAAVLAGAAWRLQGDSNYSSATNYTRTVISTNPVVIQFAPVSGWNLPSNQTVTVLPQQVAQFIASYSVTNPVMLVKPGVGLGISGTTGTIYQIQSRASLTTGSWSAISTNTIASNGFNLVLPVLTNHSTTFYRALWLPN